MNNAGPTPSGSNFGYATEGPVHNAGPIPSPPVPTASPLNLGNAVEELVHNPVPSASPLNIGDAMKVNDPWLSQEVNGSSVIVATPAPAPQSVSVWPIDTDLVYVDGTKVKLSQQSPILQGIFQDAFDFLRCSLLTVHAFPDGRTTPLILRNAIIEAARRQTVVNGTYNASAACVHQCMLTNEDYEASMIRLVSSYVMSMTLLIIFSAACTHCPLSRGGQGKLCTDHTSEVSGNPNTSHGHRNSEERTRRLSLHLSDAHHSKSININRY